jgi:hypothetical protein
MLFSREFVLRMIDYGGVSSSRHVGQKVFMKLKKGSKLVFVQRLVSEIETEQIREKLEECRVNEIYELI